MLVSPPFLVERNANETDDDWVGRCMTGGEPGQGAYPVSFNLGWHGGIHLTAPQRAGQNEPVRAIADGTVVFVRPATRRPDGAPPAEHPQAYRGWTDNGVLVIRHDTEIGTGADATVSFFSIYMHLSEVDAAVHAQTAVYRKMPLGAAGQIDGSAQRRIHFEIVCDDANVTRLVGRAAGDLSVGADGRADTLYGDIHFRLPSGTRFYAMQPRGEPGAPAHMAATDLFVGLRYAGGEGGVGHRGDATFTTYRADGTTVGTPLIEADGEYDLFTTATRIHDAAPAASRPIAAAVFDLLRFGRTVGPDALAPNDVAHWRCVRHESGEGWVNLNAQDVRRFSDADFPHWRGWTLVDDSADRDSRCDSPTIRGWLDSDSDARLLPGEAQAQLSLDGVRQKLRRSICKFPTEWNSATIDERWGWLKTVSDENPEPLSEADFEALRAHIAALAFWSGGFGLDPIHWHWQPADFIRHFRRCGWLAARELTQLLPRRHGARGALTAILWATAQTRFSERATDLNRVMRKYGIESATRQTHFLAQTYIETAMWATMEEYGHAHQQRRRDGTLYWPAPMMEFYGPFYGRGAMQLTWAGNFESYGSYRAFPGVAATYTYSDPRITQTSMHHFADPHGGGTPRRWAPRYDPGDIASDAFNACDSAGHYWVSKAIGGGRHNINRVCDEGVTTNAVGRTSVLVNGGGYGFAERQAYASYIDRFRGDGTETTADSAFVVSYGTRRHNVYVDFTPQRPR